MNGILLVDKPIGWTSFDCVAKVRGLLRSQQTTISNQQSAIVQNSAFTISKKVKVGHTGTLDPQATGLLVLVVGQYCKRAQEYSKLDKTYEVTMKLGQTSTTGDEEGEKSEVSSLQPSHGDIEAALQDFVGETEQTPPIYSAIKVNGQRAYKLARAGKEVKLEPRVVTIHKIELTDYRYPEVKFTAEVSSGTYIRSLVDDLGRELNTGAYMSALRRTSVGKFEINHSLPMADITAEAISSGLISE